MDIQYVDFFGTCVLCGSSQRVYTSIKYKEMPGEPICQVIVFCDSVIVEAGTGKNSLIGTFPTLQSQTFPLAVGRIFIHFTISNFVPDGQLVQIAVNLKQESSGGVIGSFATKLNMPVMDAKAPSSGMNLNVPLNNVIFQTPGSYKCEVLFNGEVVGSRMLDIIQRPRA